MYLDHSITQEDIAFYLSIKKESKVFQKLLISFKVFLETEFYVLKQIEGNSKKFIQARRKQEALLEKANEKIVYIQNEAPIALNLKSLYEKDSKHTGIEKIPIHFNLDSLTASEAQGNGKEENKVAQDSKTEENASTTNNNEKAYIEEEIDSEELFDLDEDIPDLLDSNVLPIANIDALIDKELINIQETNNESQTQKNGNLDLSENGNNYQQELYINGRTNSGNSPLDSLEPEIILTDENGVPFPAVVDLDALIIDELDSEVIDNTEEDRASENPNTNEAISHHNREVDLSIDDPTIYSAAINLDNLISDELEPEAINLDETNFLENSLPNIETLINEEVEMRLKKSIEELDKSSSMLEPIPENEPKEEDDTKI
ncbi:MAG: hypothetical protein KDK90_22465, partial [Leptospiraceae bacterium]|nr:hypothetical protein [Leptospiraceae bacterium]